MDIIKEIFRALDGWGEHPVFIEWVSSHKPVHTGAEEFKHKIIETADFLRRIRNQKKLSRSNIPGKLG